MLALSPIAAKPMCALFETPLIPVEGCAIPHHAAPIDFEPLSDHEAPSIGGPQETCSL